MQKEKVLTIQMNVNECLVTLCFVEKPVDGVMEKLQSVLSYAYDERVKNDLIHIAQSQ